MRECLEWRLCESLLSSFGGLTTVAHGETSHALVWRVVTGELAMQSNWLAYILLINDRYNKIQRNGSFKKRFEEN
jgi:hypothetical protein